MTIIHKIFINNLNNLIKYYTHDDQSGSFNLKERKRNFNLFVFASSSLDKYNTHKANTDKNYNYYLDNCFYLNNFKNFSIDNVLYFLCVQHIMLNNDFDLTYKKTFFKKRIFVGMLNLNANWYKKLSKKNSKKLKKNIIFLKNLINKPSNEEALLTLNLFEKFKIMFLRKNKIFNKGRYSRNRQIYRTGVYMILWLNILVIVSIYFLFYRFVFNFGMIWIIFFLFVSSFFFSRFTQNSNFSPKFFLYKVYHLIKWLYMFAWSFISNVFKIS